MKLIMTKDNALLHPTHPVPTPLRQPFSILLVSSGIYKFT